MKGFLKPATLLPVISGILISVLLFIMGDAEDAPGLSAIGFAAGFLLIMWGIYNVGAIKKGFLAPILLFCYGAGGIFLSVALLLDGEFEESPGMAIIGVALGVILIVVGIIRLRKVKIGKRR